MQTPTTSGINFGPYTQKLITEGKITPPEAELLHDFIENDYKPTTFANADDNGRTWLKSKIENNPLRQRCFPAPSYLNWPDYIESYFQAGDKPPFSLDIALAMCAQSDKN